MTAFGDRAYKDVTMVEWGPRDPDLLALVSSQEGGETPWLSLPALPVSVHRGEVT